MTERGRLALAVCLLLASPAPSMALTASEVVEKMDARQFNAWYAGAADMAMHLFLRMGDRKRAQCILDWGKSDNDVKEVDTAMRANPSLPAAAVLETLIKRQCGDYE